MPLCLNAMCINFISGSSQVDGDMIPHMITFGCLRKGAQKRECPIAADQEKAVRGGLK